MRNKIASEAEIREKESWKKILLTHQEMCGLIEFDHAYIPFETLEFWNREQLKKIVGKWDKCGEFAGCKMIPIEEWRTLLKEIE